MDCGCGYTLDDELAYLASLNAPLAVDSARALPPRWGLKKPEIFAATLCALGGSIAELRYEQAQLQLRVNERFKVPHRIVPPPSPVKQCVRRGLDAHARAAAHQLKDGASGRTSSLVDVHPSVFEAARRATGTQAGARPRRLSSEMRSLTAVERHAPGQDRAGIDEREFLDLMTEACRGLGDEVRRRRLAQGAGAHS